LGKKDTSCRKPNFWGRVSHRDFIVLGGGIAKGELKRKDLPPQYAIWNPSGKEKINRGKKRLLWIKRNPKLGELKKGFSRPENPIREKEICINKIVQNAGDKSTMGGQKKRT